MIDGKDEGRKKQDDENVGTVVQASSSNVNDGDDPKKEGRNELGIPSAAVDQRRADEQCNQACVSRVDVAVTAPLTILSISTK